ncbi:MAG: hypothetical protein QNK35_11220 [Bacteroides sp.]|nr:hypothetical protein [Bacteroides sp.]
MKILRLLIVVLFVGLVACSEDDYTIAMINIDNGTEYTAWVKVISETDTHGPKVEATLDTIQQNYIYLFSSYDETIDPCVLLSKECDSIVVTIDNPEKSVIFFGKHSTPNYTSNPFKDANAWSYGVETQEPFLRNQELLTKHIYSLVITTDSIVENTSN